MKTPCDLNPSRQSMRNSHRGVPVHWGMIANYGENTKISGYIWNISMTGFLMQVPCGYPIGTIMEIGICPATEEQICMEVEIVYLAPLADGSFCHRAAILSMSVEDKRLLRAKIRNLHLKL